MEIRKVFPDPIGGVKNNELILDKEKLISTLNWRKDIPTQGVFEVSQTNLHDFPEWQELFSWIKNQAILFWSKIGYRPDDFFYTQSWAHRYDSGGAIQFHTHTNSLISGVYYLKSPLHSGGTLFQSTKNPLQGLLQTECREITEFTAGVEQVPGIEDHLVLWPSYIDHASQPNLSNSPRYIISFNLMPTILGKENHYNWVKLRNFE